MLIAKREEDRRFDHRARSERIHASLSAHRITQEIDETKTVRLAPHAARGNLKNDRGESRKPSMPSTMLSCCNALPTRKRSSTS